MKSKVTLKAYAKINLLLDINYKRTDNYHDLFMIMQSVDLCDIVSVEKIKGREIIISCDAEGIPLDERNIAYKAAKEFFKANKIRKTGIKIDIDKRIPHAAGLAGGSADGAAVIVGLNELYETNLSEDELCEIGVKIGADVPFCIKGGTLLSQGIGEVLSKVKPLKKCYIVLAKPDCAVNTGKAYALFDENGKNHSPNQLEMLKAIQSGNLYEVAERLENVFEQFIEVKNRIEIKEVLRNHYALGVCMSGSGPTIYGIFDNLEYAEKSTDILKEYAKDIFLSKPVRKGCKIIKIVE